MRTRHTPRRLQTLLLLGLTLFAATALADYRFQWRYGNLPGETTPTSGDAGVNRIYVGSGSYTSAIVTASGDLWMSGWNSNGNLGNASMADQYSWVQVLSGVSEVALGIEHSLALRADGALWGAGAASSA